jgi:glyoxylase-like metal-dependent hydrolase (beta-lactamase superfamily II)
MKAVHVVWFIAASLMVACTRPTPTPAATSTAFPHSSLVAIGRGVYAAIRTEPLGLAGNANSLIVLRDNDVVVVDAQFTRAATRETIAAIRSVTNKPVRYVVNTHWHDDHMAGDQVYRDTFPGVRFVMHANTAADFGTIGAENRRGQVQGAPPAADRFERFLAMGLGIDSTPATPAERASVSNAIRIIREYVAESPGFQAVVATDTVQSRLTLPGTPRLNVLWFGRANTRGDLVVSVPDQRIVATGDLVVAPIPFGFGSNPAEWVAVLDSVMALRPAVLVPGHGPVMRDLSYVTHVRRMLARVRDEVAAAVARGDSLPAVRRAVTLDDERRVMTGDEKWMNYLFRNFFLGPVVQRAYEQATGAMRRDR